MGKNKIVILIVLLFIVFALLLGISKYTEMINDAKPENLLIEYMSYIEQGEYEKMYDMIDSTSKASTNEDTFVARNKNIYTGIEVENLVISDIQTEKVDKNTMTVTYNTSMDTIAGNISFTNTATFVKSNNEYYLSWSSNMIFPNLDDTDKVRVSTTQATRGEIYDRNQILLAGNSDEGRYYPYGEKMAHLIGYVQVISEDELEEYADQGYTSSSIIGKTGLEKAYEDRLSGSNGYEIYITLSSGEKKAVLATKEVENGENITLTIDAKIQNTVYEQFADDEACCLVMDSKTGEILAICSTPSYDPADFVSGMTTEEWTSLSQDETNPLYIRYQSTYAPGSSFKPVIAAIALTNDVIDADEDLGTSGTRWQNSTSWGDYFVTTLTTYSGTANLRNALVYSDNIYFAKVSLKIGSTLLATELNRIGFNKALTFAQTLNASTFSDSDTFDNEIQVADSGYGQGEILVNPVHMASIYSAFVNEGNMVLPYIEYDANKTTTYYVKNAFSKEAAETVTQDLIEVVEDSDGTAHSAYIEGVTIAGKTGTAELKASSDDEEAEEIRMV